MKTTSSLLAACFVLAATSLHSTAAIVIDNLSLGTQSFSQTLSGPTATGFFINNPMPDREVAFTFTTAGIDVFLTELAFGIAIGKPILEPIRLTLSKGSSVPGGVDPMIIGEVTPPSTSPSNQILTLLPSMQVMLEANTQYWMRVTVPTGAAVYSFVNTNNQNLAPGWTLGNSWSQNPQSPWSELTSGPQARIRMTVEAVPEPTAALLGSVGALLLLRRRRQA